MHRAQLLFLAVAVALTVPFAACEAIDDITGESSSEETSRRSDGGGTGDYNSGSQDGDGSSSDDGERYVPVWTGEYDGAGTATVYFTGNTYLDESVDITITKNSGAEVHIVLYFREVTDDLREMASGYTGTSIRESVDGTVTSDTRLEGHDQSGERIVDFSMRESGNSYVGTMDFSVQDSRGNVEDTGEIDFTVNKTEDY